MTKKNVWGLHFNKRSWDTFISQHFENIRKFGLELRNGCHELAHVVKIEPTTILEVMCHLHSHNFAIIATENLVCCFGVGLLPLWDTLGIGCINVIVAVTALNQLLCHGNAGLHLKKQVCNAINPQTLQTWAEMATETHPVVALVTLHFATLAGFCSTIESLLHSH